MKLSELKQIIKEEIKKTLNENLTHEEIFNTLKDEYFEGKTTKDLVKDKRYQDLPKDMQTRIYTIVLNRNEFDR